MKESSKPTQPAPWERLPQRDPEYGENWHIQNFLRALKEELYSKQQQISIEGHLMPERVQDRPFYYHPELGFPLFYLAYPNQPHEKGPYIERSEPAPRVDIAWICCAYASGLYLDMDIYDPRQEDAIVEIAQGESRHLPFSIRITLRTMERPKHPIFPNGSISPGKYLITPQRTEMDPYRT